MLKTTGNTLGTRDTFIFISYDEGIAKLFDNPKIKEAWIIYRTEKAIQAVGKFNRLVHDFLKLIGVSVVKSRGNDTHIVEDMQPLVLAPVFELLDKIVSDPGLSGEDRKYLIDLMNSGGNTDFEF